MRPYQTNRVAVRRFLLETQQLTKPQHKENSIKEATLKMIRELECVQLDAVAAVARNQHLVLGARVPGYQPDVLHELLADGELFEYWANAACTIPMEDYPIFESTRNRFKKGRQEELDKLGAVVDEVIHRLRDEGPLPSRSFRAADRVHGAWDNKLPKTKTTSHALNLLLDTGRIRVVQRKGSERYFDLNDRTIPQNLLTDAAEMDGNRANQAMLEKYIRAYRVFDAGDSRLGWQKMTAAERRDAIGQQVEKGELIPLEIENVQRPYFILADDLDRLKEQEGLAGQPTRDVPIRFLAPLDNLLWRRERLVDLFGFSYKWEVYTPKAKRRHGYYAMPILAGDRLIGRIDPGLDRENQLLTIRLLQLEHDVEVTPSLRSRLRDAIEEFAAFHHARDVVIEKAVQDVRVF